MKIMKVDKEGFELENGQFFEHPFPLDEVPSLEEFQKIYDLCHEEIEKKVEESKND